MENTFSSPVWRSLAWNGQRREPRPRPYFYYRGMHVWRINCVPACQIPIVVISRSIIMRGKHCILFLATFEISYTIIVNSIRIYSDRRGTSHSSHQRRTIIFRSHLYITLLTLSRTGHCRYRCRRYRGRSP